MRGKKIKKVVIVGAGSSAMLAAAFISNNTTFDVTVVDKEGGSPIGVGEATLINFKPFMTACGFDFKEWFEACDATYKTGILFPGWVKKDVWHPFKMNPMSKLNDFNENDNNGFHIDCLKLAEFIKNKIKNKVKFFNRTVKGMYGSYLLTDKGQMKADVFIDCTGFNSVLQKKTKVDLSKRLICDTAIAGHVEYKNEKEKRKYVICEAVSCGWIWKIPVKNRIGTGIVFDRSITSTLEAEKIFIEHWDNRVDIRKTINWTPYYKPSFWKHNVVSLGLAAGFIEPLESTGLALAMEGAYQFVELTKNGYGYGATVDLYNAIMKSFYEESIDFVAMHYIVSNRKEKFWEKARKLKIPPQYKLYKEEKNNIANYPNNQYSFFGGNNWVTWLKQV